MKYRIVLSSQAAESLERLPNWIQKRILRWFELLSEDPHRAGTKKLEGFDDLRRAHAGKDYVIVYRIVRVGHRREIYRRLPDR